MFDLSRQVVELVVAHIEGMQHWKVVYHQKKEIDFVVARREGPQVWKASDLVMSTREYRLRDLRSWSLLLHNH